MMGNPRVVGQIKNDTCWAAALESWLASVDPTRQATQQDLLKSMDKTDRSFGVDEFRQFVSAFGMDTAHMEVEEFVSDAIRDLIKKHSALFVSFRVEKHAPWWHDVVLYSVATDKLGQSTYSVMNPSGKWTLNRKQWLPLGLQKWDKAAFFPADDYLIVGWKAKGRAGKVYP
jgi:hypothetical protein